MFSDIGDISSIQANGAPPSILAAGGAAGESGVRVAKLNYEGSAHFTAALHQHVITFVSQGAIHCRVAGKALSHMARYRCFPLASTPRATAARTPRLY